MTKTEAVNILENDIINGHVEGNADFMDAFWMAVDALKEQPCEDAVSRTDILQKYKKYCNDNCPYSEKQRDVMCGACFMGDAIEMVEDLPSVQPERPIKSIEGLIDDIKTIDADYRSNGHNLSVEGVIEIIKEYYGADMRGEQNV